MAVFISVLHLRVFNFVFFKKNCIIVSSDYFPFLCSVLLYHNGHIPSFSLISFIFYNIKCSSYIYNHMAALAWSCAGPCSVGSWPRPKVLSPFQDIFVIGAK